MQQHAFDLSYISYFCLGGFVAGILIVGLKTVKDSPDSFVKISNSTAVAAFVGAAVFPLISFINMTVKDAGNQSLFFYPIGLAVAMIWFYGADAQGNIKNGGTDQILGWIHFMLLLGTTVGVIVLLIRLTFWP